MLLYTRQRRRRKAASVFFMGLLQLLHLKSVPAHSRVFKHELTGLFLELYYKLVFGKCFYFSLSYGIINTWKKMLII